jgi:hypothetical protein
LQNLLTVRIGNARDQLLDVLDVAVKGLDRPVLLWSCGDLGPEPVNDELVVCLEGGILLLGVLEADMSVGRLKALSIILNRGRLLLRRPHLADDLRDDAGGTLLD